MTVLLSGEVVCGVRGCLLVFGVRTEIPILSFMTVHSVQLALPGEVRQQHLVTSFDGCFSTQCSQFVGRRVRCIVDSAEMQMSRGSFHNSDRASYFPSVVNFIEIDFNVTGSWTYPMSVLNTRLCFEGKSILLLCVVQFYDMTNKYINMASHHTVVLPRRSTTDRLVNQSFSYHRQGNTIGRLFHRL